MGRTHALQRGGERRFRKAELRVVAGGAHRGVRGCRNAGVHTQHHVDGPRGITARTHAFEFFCAVDDDAPDAPGDRRVQFVVTLATAVQHEPVRRKSGAFGREQLAQRTDVDRERRAHQPLRERNEKQRFGRIGDVGVELCRGVGKRCDRRVENTGVDDEQRRAIDSCQLAGRDAAEL